MYAFLMNNVFTWKKCHNLLCFGSVFEYALPGFATHQLAVTFHTTGLVKSNYISAV